MAQRKNKQLTPEEQREMRLQRELQEIRERMRFCPEPTYWFNVGDEVRIGCLLDVHVSEIIDDGKAYLITYSTMERPERGYGERVRVDGKQRYVFWHEIRPVPTCTGSLINNEGVRLSYSQTSLGGILGRAYHFGVDMDPDYQRGYVWNDADREALIDSIFNNVDIGKFVFIARDDFSDEHYEILDGKQRLRTLLDFFENRFPYNGYYYNDLCARDKCWFTDYNISVADVANVDRKKVLSYFIMLNSTGRAMDSNHLDAVRSEYERLCAEA